MSVRFDAPRYAILSSPADAACESCAGRAHASQRSYSSISPTICAAKGGVASRARNLHQETLPALLAGRQYRAGRADLDAERIQL